MFVEMDILIFREFASSRPLSPSLSEAGVSSLPCNPLTKLHTEMQRDPRRYPKRTALFLSFFNVLKIDQNGLLYLLARNESKPSKEPR